ncbi:MAG: 2Fe-2S iron-sulfur cluster-binding protein [Casimicrobiaceae bacterium]|nr:2Fe-2S iron-sulfur cluster-binding protein [Casimicrobiaceae bacterium]
MRFHRLRVCDVQRETEEAVSIAFEVPEALRPRFHFVAGQFVTLRLWLDGEELRRSYSLCSSPASRQWRIAVKRVPDGRVSTWLNTALRVGDTVEVAEPEGRFIYRPGSARERIMCVAAGSGITPVLSILTTALESNSQAKCFLLYGNRRVRDILFREALEDLRDRFLPRFSIVHCLSREAQEWPLQEGRIDRAKLERVFEHLVDPRSLDALYVCGPDALAELVSSTALSVGVAPSAIHRERFVAPGQLRPLTPRRETRAKSGEDGAVVTVPGAWVRLTCDGWTRAFFWKRDGTTLLDAGLAQGFDLPYSCKAGVCATCRARVLAGRVRMEENFALEAHEIAQGFVLACQAHPESDTLHVSFDVR